MSRGGRRAGAGRKPGTPNRRTAQWQAEIAASGVTPLEYMLGIIRDKNAPEARRDEMAKAAAPYVHPRLAAVDHSGEMGLRRAADLSDDELATIVAQRAAAELVN